MPAIMAQGSASDAGGLGNPGDGFGTINPYNLPQAHWVVAVQVKDMKGDPVRDAKVAVQPLTGGADFRTFKTDFQGQFYTEYFLNADLARDFRVALVAEKKGYLKAREVAYFAKVDKPVLIPITLREPLQDPDLLSQEDLIATLGSRLKNLSTADGLSAKSEKDYARGVADFLERNQPDRALASFTKVVERDSACVQCRTMRALAELASSDWDGANRDLAEAVNATLKDRKAGRPEPLIFHGVMESWRHENEQATAYFAEALKYAPQDPLALQETGRAELQLQNWAAADAYLAKALSAGGGPDVRLMRVQALLNEGRSDEAKKEMTLYLGGRDIKNMPLRVRELYTQVQQRRSVEVAYAKVTSEVDEPIDYLRRITPELQSLTPADDQAPLDSILTSVGKNVSELFQNFPNTSSVEAIHQEKLRRNGKLNGEQDQKFHYLCLIPNQTWGPGFSEYRADVSGERGQPRGLQDGFMLTSGFTSASLIFHPAYQSQSTFRYLGRQKLNERDTLVLAFAQQPTKSKLYGTFKSGDVLMTTFTQGLAWVDAQTYQILRLRTDLLKPLPEVKLERQTTEINYAEVHFKSIDGGFWLPQEVNVTVSWGGKSLRNQHQYSAFQVFNVAATQKIDKPKPSQQAAGLSPEPGSQP
jgi:tetratricopeptide (TPR) repeat protein